MSHVIQLLKSMSLTLGVLLVLGPLSMQPAGAQEKLVPSWFKIDADGKSVDIHFDAAWNTNNGPFNFNGYTKGEATVVIPADWKAYVTFRTLDADLPHSALIGKPGPTGEIPQNAGERDAAI
ncbi:MAG: sulfocyanin-like copper-binding protein, partial [Deltaproteobacteria bacterium]|nr:sulfocyanin-like copper-binding protein [Deltaproteobacteria bacterium]